MKPKWCAWKCSSCLLNSLDSNLVKGKIVLCHGLGNGESELLSGAAGTVRGGRGDKDNPQSFPLPATYLGADDGESVFNYIDSIRYFKDSDNILIITVFIFYIT